VAQILQLNGFDLLVCITAYDQVQFITIFIDLDIISVQLLMWHDIILFVKLKLHPIT